MDRAQVTEFIAGLEAAAYSKGRRNALEEVLAAVTRLLEESPTSQHSLPLEPSPKQDRQVQAPMRENSDQFRVFLAISREPGIRGVGIVEALNKAGTPIKERTMRTALHRLRALNKIRLHDQGWYATGQTPGFLSDIEQSSAGQALDDPGPPSAGSVAERLNATV